MGMPQSQRIFDSFGLTAAEQLKFAKVISEFDRYFVPQKNVVHERAVFHQRHQQHGETVEAYLSALRELARHCNFTDVDDQIRDVFIIGLRDKDCSMQIQLLPSDKCTLKESTALARQYEMVKSQLNNPVQQVPKKEEEELIGRVANEEEEETVNRVKARAAYPKKPQSQGTPKCSYCGSRHERGKRHCPASNKKCRKCGKLNHFASVCKTPANTDAVLLGSVKGERRDSKPCLQQRVLFNGSGSEWQEVLSGVPQVSVLGPLLFLIFVNSIEDGVKSAVLEFADYLRFSGLLRVHMIGKFSSLI